MHVYRSTYCILIDIQYFDRHTWFENRIYHFQTYVDDPDKDPFYTGLPNLGVLKLMFDMVESQMSGSSKTLTKEEEYFYLASETEDELPF